MEAPVVWFLFHSTIADAIERVGSFEQAVVELSRASDDAQRRELLQYFDRAIKASESDCRLIEATKIRNSIYIEPKSGSCADYYTWIKAIFSSVESHR